MNSYLILLIIGFVSIIALSIKSFLTRRHFSAVPIYILFGFFLSFLNSSVIAFPEGTDKMMTLFGDIGLIIILFQVGFESNIQKLLEQVSRAIFISVFEVVFSGIIMFLALYYLVNVNLSQSILYSVAFSATSIAIAITAWRDANQLQKPHGQLLVDLSAMDDFAAITLLAVSLPVVLSLNSVADTNLHANLIIVILLTIIKLVIFISLCYLFAHYLEPKLSHFLRKYEVIPDPVITILCISLIFGALSGILGLSIALGAFLAGLAFSRDSKAVRLLSTYQSLETFFIPFFFISVGFSVSLIGLLPIISILILIIAAFIGKIIGVTLPACLSKISISEGLLLGLSMVPRAEVTLVILKYANSLEFLNIPSQVYSAAIIVVLITCMVPLILKPLLTVRA